MAVIFNEILHSHHSTTWMLEYGLRARNHVLTGVPARAHAEWVDHTTPRLFLEINYIYSP